MTLGGPLREIEAARAELVKTMSRAEGWKDKQRHTFDAQRIKPLEAAGTRLQRALERAQEQCDKAERLLSER